MSRIDLHTAAAFLKLRAPELEPVVKHMSALRTETLEGMAKVSDESQWRLMQGRAQVLQELLDLVKSSDELAVKLSRPQR